MDKATWYTAYLKAVEECKACPARKECRQPVAGIGSLYSRVIFVGRNPGETEDKIGFPFVGRAGKYFTHFLNGIGLDRKEVFTTNMCLCHTQNNRLLSKEEAKKCLNRFLIPTFDVIKPQIVVVFGEQPNYFINGLSKITQHSGKLMVHRQGFVVLPSIHPAAACYDRSPKQPKIKMLWESFRVLKEFLDENPLS